MPRREQMCPNAECEHYGQPTTIMGGCDCGTQLVPHKLPEPTDDQLESVLFHMGFSTFAFTFRWMTNGREAALNFHKLVAKAATGDAAANARLAMLREKLGDKPREEAA